MCSLQMGSPSQIRGTLKGEAAHKPYTSFHGVFELAAQHIQIQGRTSTHTRTHVVTRHK